MREILREGARSLSPKIASVTHPFVEVGVVCLSGRDTPVSVHKEWRESHAREVSETVSMCSLVYRDTACVWVPHVI